VKAIICALFCFCIMLRGGESKERWPTPAEAKKFAAYTTYAEALSFIDRLKAVDRRLRVFVAGKTREGSLQALTDRDIICFRLNAGKAPSRNPARFPIRVLISAGQHGNEQSGVEACLRLLRDVVSGRCDDLLRELDIIVFPAINPYGNDHNCRENEQGLDLNRDHSKLESPETEALHRVFAAFMPEVTYDLHEKGYDYYQVNVGTVTNLNIAPEIPRFSHQVILPSIEKELKAKGIACHEYMVKSFMGDISASGAVMEEPENAEVLYRLSTTDINDGRTSCGIFNTFSFIQEIAARDDLRYYPEHIRHQHEGLIAFLQAVCANTDTIRTIVSGSRAKLEKGADEVILRMEHSRDPQQGSIFIQRFSDRPANPDAPLGVANRDIARGEPVSPGDILPPPGNGIPAAPAVTVEEIKNWFPAVLPRLTRPRAEGYVIPGQLSEIANLLVKLGARVFAVERDTLGEIQYTRIVSITPSPADYTAPPAITVETMSLKAIIQKGDFYVPGRGHAANLVALLLEPESEFGLLRYAKFKLPTQVGDVYPFGRIVAWKGEDGLTLTPYRNFSYLALDVCALQP